MQPLQLRVTCEVPLLRGSGPTALDVNRVTNVAMSGDGHAHRFENAKLIGGGPRIVLTRHIRAEIDNDASSSTRSTRICLHASICGYVAEETHCRVGSNHITSHVRHAC